MIDSTVQRMISESSRVWLASMDRSEIGSGPIIVTESPDSAIYLERRDGYQGDLPSIDGWVLIFQPLRAVDAESFYAAFGSHWPLLLRCSLEVSGKPTKIRALIKNGRQEGWNLSLDMPVQALTALKNVNLTTDL